MYNNKIVITFVSTKLGAIVKPKTSERKRYEKELLYYLHLFNELKGREGVDQTLVYIGYEIDKLVELLKQM